MREEQLLKLTDEYLVIEVAMSINSFINSCGDSATDEEKLASLNNSEQVAYAVASFYCEVANGGLCQYFSNPSRSTAPYLSKALKSVGAPQMDVNFSDFVSKHNIDVANLNQFYVATTEEYIQKTELLPFNEFDNTFIESNDKEDLRALNATFIRKHITDFTK